jgi:hypothetical protein
MNTEYPLTGRTTSAIYPNQIARSGSLLYRTVKSFLLNLYHKNILHSDFVVTVEKGTFKITWCMEDSTNNPPTYSRAYTKTVKAPKGTLDGQYVVSLTREGMVVLKSIGGKAKKLKSRT